MKVAYLTTGCFDKGGISRYNRYQITVLRELWGDQNVQVFSLLGPSENDFEEPFSVTWHGNGTDWKSKGMMIKKVMQSALLWKPDIILIAHLNLSGLGFIAARLCKAISVLNVYGLEVWTPKSTDAGWGLKKVQYIISDCHNTAGYLVQKKIRKKDSISVIWDCIDTEKFRPYDKHNLRVLDKYNIPDPAKYFNLLSLGRLSKPDALYKGYDRLIKVFASIAPQFDHARLIIAGRGNYTDELKQMAAELELSSKVIFTGSIDEQDLAEVYNSCHLFSLITESGEGKGEGIPLTPLEAMACAKPILVGNQDGSAEAIINENGAVVDPNDLETQEKIITAYIRDPQQLATHAENAWKVSQTYFTYEHFKNKHIAFFQKLNVARR